MSRLRVLLIDDEEELVSALQERLELRDIEADYLLSGHGVLEKVKAKDYDVVILDIMMPGVNGLEVLKEIKNLRPELQVILLTGRGNIKDSETGLKFGAFDYIVKPVNIDILIEKMREAAGKHDG
ncbi:response regulator [Acidobacteriota bacterium]